MIAELGTRAWEIEWADHLPLTADGDMDHDAIKYKRMVLHSLGVARRIAREKWPSTVGVFGVVEITPVELVDPFGDGFRSTFRWEPCGDSEFYEGDDD